MATTSVAVKPEGFSLIELIIALAIVAILATIALPSYQQQLLQTQRSDGTTALATFAQKMERYFLENGSYSGATTSLYQELSNQGYYQLSVTSTSDSYQLSATPLDAQTEDSECATLTLNELGERGITGSSTTEQCW